MNNLAEKIEVLEQKIKIFARKYDIIKQENVLLMEENIQLKQNIGKTNPRSEQKTGDNIEKVTKISIEPSQSNDEIKQKLDKYISEIDLCIKELSNV